jgi:hypothetical protein
LEGWELGAATVGLTLAFALLGIPRAAEPDVFPLPTIDREESRGLREREALRADEAERAPLSFDVRAVGEAFRRYGRFTAVGNENGAALELSAFRTRIAELHNKGADEALLRLRAVQTRFFLHALEAWEESGQKSRELAELGGDFPERSEQNAWFVNGRLVLSESERATLFRVRWSELAGMRDTVPFAPTRNEWRVYYRFLLSHPEVPSEGPYDARRTAERQLTYVAALERRDTEYFANLTRGVLAYRMGAMLPAAEAFRAHLAAHPDGPWQLRARNYLIHTLAELGDPELE